MIDFGEHTPHRKNFDLTPMIDVVFLLLIFFMLTSIYSKPALPVVLPEADTVQNLVEKPITVLVRQDGNIFVGEQAIAPGMLRAELKRLLANDASPAVAVASDKGVPFGNVVEVLDSARSAGARSISVLAERK